MGAKINEAFLPLFEMGQCGDFAAEVCEAGVLSAEVQREVQRGACGPSAAATRPCTADSTPPEKDTYTLPQIATRLDLKTKYHTVLAWFCDNRHSEI